MPHYSWPLWEHDYKRLVHYTFITLAPPIQAHYENMPIQIYRKYIENFASKNWKFSDKKALIFSFLLKT